MAKDSAKSMKRSTGEQYPYPSQFGSHAGMVDKEETAKLNDPNLVFCRDSWGLYKTERCHIDSGLADPNRNAHSRFTHLKSNNSED